MKPTKRKRGVGRPSKGRDAKTIAVIVKISARERAVWRQKAKAAGLAVGPWLLQPRRDELAKGE
jgi:hypothetical protein